MKRIERNKRFSYGQWRRRNVENDKLIDEELIRSYLEEGAKKPKTVSEEFYYTVERLHRRLIS